MIYNKMLTLLFNAVKQSPMKRPTSKRRTEFVAFRPTREVNARLRMVARQRGMSVTSVVMWALSEQLPKMELVSK